MRHPRSGMSACGRYQSCQG